MSSTYCIIRYNSAHTITCFKLKTNEAIIDSKQPERLYTKDRLKIKQ